MLIVGIKVSIDKCQTWNLEDWSLLNLKMVILVLAINIFFEMQFVK